MAIKKYNQFLNESQSEYGISFIDAITNLGPFYSFSKMAIYMKVDPEVDYQEFQKNMDNVGWDIETIKNFFNDSYFQNDEEKYNYIEKHLGSEGGEVDYYLYRTFDILGLDKNRIRLGGDGWGDLDVAEDEAFIKYSYGYHKTPYGKLFMDQIGITKEEFRLKSLLYLSTYLEGETRYGLYRSLTMNNRTLELDFKKFKLDELEDDYRLVIFTKSISDKIKSLDGEYVSKEKIDAWYIDKLSEFSIENITTNEELIVYFKN